MYTDFLQFMPTNRGLSDYRIPGREDRLEMPSFQDRGIESEGDLPKAGRWAGILGGLGTATGLLGPVGAGLGVVGAIAGMIGRNKAQKEAEEQREKDEALRRASWMSGRRERATGRWGY